MFLLLIVLGKSLACAYLLEELFSTSGSRYKALWISQIEPMVQTLSLFMCCKSNFVNYKDIIGVEVYFPFGQEYIDSE